MQLDSQFFNAHDPGRQNVITNHNLAEYSENQKFIENMATELLAYVEIQGEGKESCLMNYYINQCGVLATYGGLVEDIEKVAFGSQSQNNNNMSIPAYSDLFSDDEEPERTATDAEYRFSGLTGLQTTKPFGGEEISLDC